MIFHFCYLPVLSLKLSPILLRKKHYWWQQSSQAWSYWSHYSHGIFSSFFLALYVLAGASFFSILWSSLISLHTLQALWLNYVLRSMSKHGRCVICREFPFIHYYSEGWAQLSASRGCAQHGSLCAQRGPTNPLSLTLLFPSPPIPCPPLLYTHAASSSFSPFPSSCSSRTDPW